MPRDAVTTPTGPGFVRGYWRDSTRPLISLVFVTPLLLLYELGVVSLGPQAMRNGADIWLRQLLEHLGFGQYFLLPGLTCGILLAWHHMRHERWRVSGRILLAMLSEALLLAGLLIALAQFQGRMFTWAGVLPTCASATSGPGLATRLIGYCGAGIYEELLFRLMLLPACACALRSGGCGKRTSIVWAIAVTSLLFAAAHYRPLTPQGEVWNWYSFAFRSAAGTFFAALFVARGFGITAGAHAFYDVFVEIV